jgi:hypothetical protein
MLTSTLMTSNVQASCDMQQSVECHHHSDMEMGEQDTEDSKNSTEDCSTKCCSLTLSLEKSFIDETELKVTITQKSFEYIPNKTHSIVFKPFFPPIHS